MNIMIVLSYIAWVALTLWLAALPLGVAAFRTMDTQNYGIWAVAVVCSLLILGISGTALVMLS